MKTIKQKNDYSLNNKEIERLERSWKKSLPRLTNKELLAIFPETKEVLREKIIETYEQISDCNWRIFTSYWHSLKAKETIPICEATAEFISINELQPLKTRLNRLILQHKLLTSPKTGKSYKYINIEEIKTQVSLKKLIEQYGIKLKRAGKCWVGLCPFHSEKKPSFFIYPDNNFHCFGCKAHGDIFTFLKLKEGLSFKQTLKLLSKIP